jgi:hypothetical protein
MKIPKNIVKQNAFAKENVRKFGRNKNNKNKSKKGWL